MPQRLVGGVEVDTVSGLNAIGLVDELEGLAIPAFGFVIKRPDAGEHTVGIAKFAGELADKKSRGLNEFISFTVDLRLELFDPQEFGVLLGIAHRFVHAHQFQGEANSLVQGRYDGSGNGPLIEPDDGRPQGVSIPIHGDDGAALARQADPGDLAAVDVDFGHQSPADLTELVPVVFRVLLGATGRQ